MILLGPSDGYVGDDPTLWFLSDYELLTSPEFHRRYEPYRFAAAVPPEVARQRPRAFVGDETPVLMITAYVRRDSTAAARLRAGGTPLPAPAVRAGG